MTPSAALSQVLHAHQPHLQLPLPHRTDACAVGYTTNSAIVHAVGCTFRSFICGYVFYRTVSCAISCTISRAVSGTGRVISYIIDITTYLAAA